MADQGRRYSKNRVKAFWDGDAKVWVAEGVDVPGLTVSRHLVRNFVTSLRLRTTLKRSKGFLTILS
jgi:hypothetical protein